MTYPYDGKRSTIEYYESKIKYLEEKIKLLEEKNKIYLQVIINLKKDERIDKQKKK